MRKWLHEFYCSVSWISQFDIDIVFVEQCVNCPTKKQYPIMESLGIVVSLNSENFMKVSKFKKLSIF